ncbi:type I 3-dehydroquinate dehydratase [Aquimarina sp. RZ0]|uniref:type I 3-dehydroquinate dehydratase n=1 Tax=Aquimarina sp. RZ0 TaxID=2607730 RepID=UPI0011F1827E|nr:type I 3-dehydroquinate dehydratase [Aquimarina sp. RZ0]KAA1246572.1 type I 3-dehydroquinate dehydratase [Aquimarina sp. RZ0]
MEKKINIVTTITRQDQLYNLHDLPLSVSLLEIRADLLYNTQGIKNSTAIPLVYILRSKKEGGKFEGSKTERQLLLIEASYIYDYIELEGERDLIPELLDIIPAKKRRIAWYGAPKKYTALYQQVLKYLKTPANTYKIVVTATNHKDSTLIIRLLDAINNRQVIGYAVGKTAEWTQILAPFMGAPEVPSVMDYQDQSTPYFTPNQLIGDYGLPNVYRVEQLFGIVGNPVLGSISPSQHNSAYQKLGLPYLYLPFETRDFSSFMNEIMENNSIPIPLSGVTVVAPFKREGYMASKYNKGINNKVFGVCNGMIKKDQEWISFSTDASGAIAALELITTDWYQKSIAIIGCGGTGRTIAASLKKFTSEITLVNRTLAKGIEIAAAIKLPFIALHEFNAGNFDIIIHATPLGKHEEETPFELTDLKSDSIVIDHSYSLSKETALVRYCKLCNIKVIDGIEIARLQINQQFKFLTDKEESIINVTDQNLKIN